MPRPTDKLRRLIAGNGPNRIRLTLAEVGPCRDELAAILAGHPEIGYAHDPFLDQWTLWREKTNDLFARAG